MFGLGLGCINFSETHCTYGDKYYVIILYNIIDLLEIFTRAWL